MMNIIAMFVLVDISILVMVFLDWLGRRQERQKREGRT